MNDQAKRWTAECTITTDGMNHVMCDGHSVADCHNYSDASRLAACADLLRGVEDLSAVAVMTWADVERVRAELAQLIGHGHTSGFARRCAERALDVLPVPPKGGRVKDMTWEEANALGGWIPCGDGVPDGAWHVIVCTGSHVTGASYYRSKGGWVNDSGEPFWGEVSAWRLFPSPYTAPKPARSETKGESL